MIKIPKKKPKLNIIGRIVGYANESPLMAILALIAFILILAGIVGAFRNPDTFNPETDVCMAYECTIKLGRTIVVAADHNETECAGLSAERTDGKKGNASWQCKEWRPKTFCEKCLGIPYDKWHRNANNFIDEDGFCDQECVCDERDIKQHLEHTICGITPAYVSRTLSGMSSWVDESGRHGACVFFTGENAKSVRFANQTHRSNTTVIEKKNCISAHEKTIHDLTCAELQDYYEKGPQCKHTWPGDFKTGCKYPDPYTEKQDLLYEMLKKNCTANLNPKKQEASNEFAEGIDVHGPRHEGTGKITWVDTNWNEIADQHFISPNCTQWTEKIKSVSITLSSRQELLGRCRTHFGDCTYAKLYDMKFSCECNGEWINVSLYDERFTDLFDILTKLVCINSTGDVI